MITRFFKSAFSKGTTSYIVGVTLGENISDDGNKGKFDPVNMHIPIIIGSYHEFFNRYNVLKNDIENANWQLRLDASKNETNAYNESKKWLIFRDDDYINRCRENVKKSENGIESNNKLLDKNKTLLIKLGEYLKHESDCFKMFVDGIEQDKFYPFELE